MNLHMSKEIMKITNTNEKSRRIQVKLALLKMQSQLLTIELDEKKIAKNDVLQTIIDESNED